MTLTKEQQALLEQNWDEVQQSANFLWNTQFKTKFAAVKMDREDYDSLVGYELTKSIPLYNPEVSNFKTFSYYVILNKANTAIRDSMRDKRRAQTEASSLDIPVGEDDETSVLNTLEYEDKVSEANPANAYEFLNGLSRQRLIMLILRLVDFNRREISKAMGITSKQYNDLLAGLKCCERTDILLRRSE